MDISSAWKDVYDAQIDVGSTWRTIRKLQINIGGSAWKTIFEKTPFASYTFGNTDTTAGSTAVISNPTGFVWGMQFTTSAGADGGSATSMTWKLSSSAGTNLKFALYGDSGDAPASLLASGTGSMGATAASITINFTTPYVLSGSTKYWMLGTGDTDTTLCTYTDTTSQNSGRRLAADGYTAFPSDPFSGFTSTYTVRLYQVYTTYFK